MDAQCLLKRIRMWNPSKSILIRTSGAPHRRSRSRPVRWLAPITAAAAVAGLITGLTVAGQTVAGQTVAGRTVAGLTVAGNTANHRVGSQAIPHGTPRYYVALTGVAHRHVTVITAT